ncbi:MAG: hypothetical protein M1469_05385 [Bacteroidetes bacterium]|nr:hypothetical protein [Bacteroidota bacterium]
MRFYSGMIPVLIFWIHITGGVYLFAKTYYKESLAEAFLTLGFAAIVFTAGWTLSSFLIHLIFGPKGLSVILNSDSLSLILLTLLEAVFYKMWFAKSKHHENADAQAQ